MEIDQNIPEELLISLGTETREFAIKSRRQRSARRSLGKIIFSIVWLGFTSFFVVLMLGPVFTGGSTETIINGQTTTISAGNLKPALPMIGFIVVFLAIGLVLLISSLYSIFQRGGWFVGTPARLVWFKKGILKSYDWSQFSGNIEIRGSNSKGNITLEMRTGTIRRTKGGGEYYVPDIVYLIGISNAYEIGKIVRKRIEEHKPS